MQHLLNIKASKESLWSSENLSSNDFFKKIVTKQLLRFKGKF